MPAERPKIEAQVHPVELDFDLWQRFVTALDAHKDSSGIVSYRQARQSIGRHHVHKKRTKEILTEACRQGRLSHIARQGYKIAS